MTDMAPPNRPQSHDAASSRLRAWLDGLQISARLGCPEYANPSELKADLCTVLDALDRVKNEAPDYIKRLVDHA